MLPLNTAEIKRVAPTKITHLAFGVRYEPQYALMDRIGSVMDSILRANETPFGPEMFPFSQSDVNTSILTDFEGNALRISQQDTLMQLRLQTRNLDRVSELSDDFNRYILRPLREISKLTGIMRYGVVLGMEDISGLRKRPVHHYLSPEFPEANSLAMRFTRRLPADEALVRKRVDDYRNAIYTLKETEEGEVALSLDYQEYFKPALNSGDWADKPFPKFISRGLAYFEGEFQRYFKEFVDVAEVA